MNSFSWNLDKSSKTEYPNSLDCNETIKAKNIFKDKNKNRNIIKNRIFNENRFMPDFNSL